MASYLGAELGSLEEAVEDWVVISPDIMDSHLKMQNAWYLLRDSVLSQLPQIERGKCTCGCKGKPSVDKAHRRSHIRQEAILSNFRDVFEYFSNSTNTVNRDLTDISRRIVSLREINRANSTSTEIEISDRLLPETRFKIRSVMEFEAALVFILGCLVDLDSSPRPQHEITIEKFNKLIRDTAKDVTVPPVLKFDNNLTLFSILNNHKRSLLEDPNLFSNQSFSELRITTPSGEVFTIASLRQRFSSPANEELVFDASVQSILAESVRIGHRTDLDNVFFTLRHLALIMYDHGRYSEALSLYTQLFITECILRGSRTKEMLETFEQLAGLAFCCCQPLFVKHIVLKLEEIRKHQADRKYILADRCDRFYTVCEFFYDPPTLLPRSCRAIVALVLDVLEKYSIRPSDNFHIACTRFEISRAVSRRLYEEGDLIESERHLRNALAQGFGDPDCYSDSLDPRIMRDLMQMDLATVLAKSPQKEKKRQAEYYGQAAFRGFIGRAQDGEFWADVHACRDVLLGCGLSHWSFDRAAKAPFTIKGTLGSGAYSIVNSITWAGDESVEYAQKIYRIPIRNTNKDFYMKAINNELEAIRKLKLDPHIVRIEYTYTEKQTFVVVLSPRADEDLQSYLEGQSSSIGCHLPWGCQCLIHTNRNLMGNLLQVENIIQAWFYCLASTLATIHDQGVRHKDIKSRNILLRDSQVLYADFGSSKIFESELTSATTGTVNSGNTPMYSAPEVMASQRRGRSADIFSLGCVFSEMLAIKGGAALAEYHEFRNTTFRDEWGITNQSCAYYKTLDKVDEWFDAYPERFREYRAFVRPMLAADGHERPTAEATAAAVRNFYCDVEASHCGACGKQSELLEKK